MNRKIIVFVVGLLALGALEFGLLGASASGLVGGSGHPLPPISQRQNVAFTATATPTITPIFVATATPPPPPSLGCAISPPNASPPCSALAASIELMRPDPAAISCDGISASVLRVFVRNILGNPVDDGTPVQFSVYNGSPSPYFALTKGGAAATAIVIYSDAYSFQPNVTVRSGDMETAIRLRCKPNSGCPLSPPPNASPPCGPTPVPCNPSPGAGVNSTPCQPPPFTCNPSPGIGDVNSPPCVIVTPISPPICAPNQTSPPCTPLSPPPAPPPPTGGTGGQIYIGTPELINGKLRVPVNTTASTDPYRGFNAYLTWSGAIAVPSSPLAETTTSSVFGTAQIFCMPGADPIVGASLFGCATLDRSATTAAGNLTNFWLQPTGNGGCLQLHLFTYGGPDEGGTTRGTYTVNSNPIAAQLNTYGPDVYVNTTDGTPCTPPPGAPTATPTPPGSDAHTATAVAGPPQATPTAVPTATQPPAPSPTPERQRPTRTPERDDCADVTGDGRVTAYDVAAVGAHIIGRYNAKYDLNHDGRVNMQDVRIAIGQLGRRC